MGNNREAQFNLQQPGDQRVLKAVQRAEGSDADKCTRQEAQSRKRSLQERATPLSPARTDLMNLD